MPVIISLFLLPVVQSPQNPIIGSRFVLAIWPPPFQLLDPPVIISSLKQVFLCRQHHQRREPIVYMVKRRLFLIIRTQLIARSALQLVIPVTTEFCIGRLNWDTLTVAL